MNRFFNLIIILSLIAPVAIFLGYIIMDEGDQFTSEHYMVTALGTVPFIFAILVKFLMSSVDKNSQ